MTDVVLIINVIPVIQVFVGEEYDLSVMVGLSEIDDLSVIRSSVGDNGSVCALTEDRLKNMSQLRKINDNRYNSLCIMYEDAISKNIGVNLTT